LKQNDQNPSNLNEITSIAKQCQYFTCKRLFSFQTILLVINIIIIVKINHYYNIQMEPRNK